ncbi:hypothetical protein [Xenorhabdus hominickii]|uniref:Uncharacterized protein n=1 Tax=Xenorhabdus hominickii TaxID=351679 RepID=A0A2G0Q4T2_XENHO|nr:hypothetical protein [Xenorhabdus hominickii]AOM40127.1 hypothetical protein A9255_05760 [Xenorhabdus hominickii]PHM54234.1 hypothetical protein Xhom_03310 [Xenorhabdus hominickii]
MKSRYDIRYSLSALELSRITKSIKDHRKTEIMKPYGMFINMWKICFFGASFAVFWLFLNAVILNLKADDVSDAIIRIKDMNICAFVLLGVSLVGFGITEKLEQFVMKKNEKKKSRITRSTSDM